MRAALLLPLALVAAGCAAAPPEKGAPLPVHLVHRYPGAPAAERFDVPADAGPLHVLAKLENFYQGRCPGPSGELTLRDPAGQVYGHLRTDEVPFRDCVLAFERNATLAPGAWTVEYAGGSDALGSVVDVRRAE